MGIKGLKKLIISSKKCMRINDFSNKKVAIDTSIFLYKFKYGGNYLKSFYNQITKLQKFGITPLYILDNKAHEMKQDTKDKRTEHFKKLEDKIKTLEINSDGSGEELYKLKKQNIKITESDVERLKELFDICGINYSRSYEGCDAEGICSYLCKTGVVDAVVSNDIDTLTYGGSTMIANLNNVNDDIDVFILEDVLADLGVDYDQFVRMCVIMGCDFSNGIFKYGPKKSLKAVKNNEFLTNTDIDKVSKIFTGISTSYTFLQKPMKSKEEIMKFLNDNK